MRSYYSSAQDKGCPTHRLKNELQGRRREMGRPRTTRRTSFGGDTEHRPYDTDFIQAFYAGRNDTRITTLEFDGVELAAIQALNQKLKAKDAEIEELKSRLEKIEKMVQKKESSQ